MARVIFDRSAPCGFLIVCKGGRPDRESDTILVQTDWDFPGVASRMGWTPCQCGGTDGTVDCAPCGRIASEMIAEAYDFIQNHEGDRFSDLDDYFQGN